MKLNIRVLLFGLLALWALSGAKTCRADDWPLPVRVYYIPARSMEPTLQVNDRLLVDMRAYDSRAPQNGEIALFKAPAAALGSRYAGADVDFVKRVAGVPGQRVEMVKGRLKVDGALVSEPYAKWQIESDGVLPSESESDYRYDMKIVGGVIYSRDYLADEPGLWTRSNLTVAAKEQARINAAKSEAIPANQFLMLGDYRANSNDSHLWGFAPRKSFVGRALFVFWPLSHLKMLP